MFRSSTLVVAAVLGAGSAAVAGCERGMLGGGGGAGQLAGSQGTGPGSGASGSTGAGILGIGGGQNCASIDRPAPPAGLDVFLAVTAPASMNWDATNNACADGCGATSKWAQATAAINTVVWETQSKVDWGFKLVPEDRAGPCYVAPGPTVAVPTNGNAIPIAIAGRTSTNGGLSNGGSNAARAAVDVAASHLSTLTDDHLRVIVLVTDGAPNCPPDGGDADDGALAVQAIMQAARLGFPTFVIGFAPAPEAYATLDRMAVAGGAEGTTPFTFSAVASTSELASALRTMVADSARCVFTIPPPPTNDGATTRWDINVSIDGVRVPFDEATRTAGTTPTTRRVTCSSTDRSATTSWRSPIRA